MNETQHIAASQRGLRGMRQWPGKNYLGVVLGAGVIFLLALLTIPPRPAKPLPAGWDELAFCLDLVSFDGKKRLTLAGNGSASVVDRAGSGAKTISGTWELSGKRDRYSITFGDQETLFERVAPPGADTCILAAGSAYPANLRQSWFAIRPDEDPLDD